MNYDLPNCDALVYPVLAAVCDRLDVSCARRRKRSLRREQARQAFERHQSTAEYDRGVAMLIMWANAAVEVSLYAVLALALPLAAWRFWRNRQSGAALHGRSSTTLIGVIGARFIYRKGVKRWLRPAVERRLQAHPGPDGPAAA